MQFGHQFGGLVVVLVRMSGMGMREHRVVRGLFMLVKFVVGGRLPMMFGGFFVMFGGGGMMLGGVLGMFGVRH